MKKMKTLLACLVAITAMIGCSKKDKGSSTASNVCQSGYIQVDGSWMSQYGQSLPQGTYYQTSSTTTQTQQYYYGNNYAGSTTYCVQQSYYNNVGGSGNSQYCNMYPTDPSCYNSGGNNQYCNMYPSDPSCYNGGGNYCQQNPWAQGCGNNNNYYCYYYPYDPMCWY